MLSALEAAPSPGAPLWTPIGAKPQTPTIGLGFELPTIARKFAPLPIIQSVDLTTKKQYILKAKTFTVFTTLH